MPQPTCAIDHCDQPRRRRGWCAKHYQRWHRHGDPHAVQRGPKTTPLADRLPDLIDLAHPLGCWTWTASTNDHGYGRTTVEGRPQLAHRAVYELLIGTVPDGMTLDHLCRNTACVNPDHLEPVTHAENVRRGHGWAGRNARKRACPAGHPYTRANTIRLASGSRRCRTCHLAQAA